METKQFFFMDLTGLVALNGHTLLYKIQLIKPLIILKTIIVHKGKMTNL